MADIRNQQWRISVSAKCRSLHFKAVVWRLLPRWIGGGRINCGARFSAHLNLGNARLLIDSGTGHKMGEGRWRGSKCVSFGILAKLVRFGTRVNGVCKSVWKRRLLGRKWKRLLAQDHLAPTMHDLIQPPSWKTLREVVTRFLALFSLVIKLILHNFCLILLLIVLRPSLKDVFLYIQNKQGKLNVVVGKQLIEVAVSYVLHVIIQLVLSQFYMKFGRSKFIGLIVIKALLEKARGWKRLCQPQMIEEMKFR